MVLTVKSTQQQQQYVIAILAAAVVLILSPSPVYGFLNHQVLPLLGPPRTTTTSSKNSRLYSSSFPPVTTAAAFEAKPNSIQTIPDLQAELKTMDLGLCHGMLHACGVRRLKDLQYLTDDQIQEMGADNLDRRNMVRARTSATTTAAAAATRSSTTFTTTTLPTPSSWTQNNHNNNNNNIPRDLSTKIDGAFPQPVRQRFDKEEPHDFFLEAICSKNEIYKGKLFTAEQCEHLNRMAEYSAYRGIGTIDAGWTNQVYTLTAQHMLCKDIPGMVPATQHLFTQLFRQLYPLFGDRIIPGTIRFENEGEPHLVKYNGKAKGTALHTDNSGHVYITLNVVLSDKDDYGGGGTYIPALEDTIQLQQGEMLIHLGDLVHAGAPITSGVRRLLIGFVACEWKDTTLNQPSVNPHWPSE